ncbi:DUF4179 domain-containing protein [Brevibacillus borstelensis]|uniref:DUF4179 domain-containing protein n=1 Tax=Brevibacillus borstelensis TaxID=45462 RepID=UPI001378537A|nr:DUF4179 domain-containing protein [Brevibacillus borstelensis]
MMGNKRTPQWIGGLVLAGVVTVAGITAALPGETSTVQAAPVKTATGAQTKAAQASPSVTVNGMTVTVNEVFYDGSRMDIGYAIQMPKTQNEAEALKMAQTIKLWQFTVDNSDKPVPYKGSQEVERVNGNQFKGIRNIEITEPLPDKFTLHAKVAFGNDVTDPKTTGELDIPVAKQQKSGVGAGLSPKGSPSGQSGAGGSATPAPDKAKEPLPKHVQQNYQKLLEAEPLLKGLKMTGYSKSPMTDNRQIRGVWGIVLHETGNFDDKGKMFASMQFDSTTGELLDYGSFGSPTFREEPKKSTQTEAFYRQKAAEFFQKLLGDEHVKQYQKSGTLEISMRTYNKTVERQTGTAQFDYKGERFQIVVDVNGYLHTYNRIPLSHLLKQR